MPRPATAPADSRPSERHPELHLVVAARPNLPKIAALWHALREHPVGAHPVILHTGQHHDAAMFGDHLADLGLPAPNVSLGIAGGSHAELTGRTLMACAAFWETRRPALVVVPGDVDGALAAALAARKLGIPVAHLEAGLRCGDHDMPEEINRRAIDAVSDLLWAPDQETAARLLAEGHSPRTVRAVGNAMVDSLLRALPAARRLALPEGLRPGGYGLLTLHRPANVDSPAALAALLRAAGEAARRLPLVWPVHPRTAARLAALGAAQGAAQGAALGTTQGLELPPGILRLPPQRYGAFLSLMARARLVATDSGGLQEEAAALDLPCLTLRPSTERPVTLLSGANRLVRPEDLPRAVEEVLGGRWPAARPIPLWDGQAGARMAVHLREALPGLGAPLGAPLDAPLGMAPGVAA
ncbi:UDP-N-acetylglucosamine 2-epimerase (non-hydrolyzing) [Roseomonas gilardii]|uniref:UDP-N-acetylglucosamine 2-epimerase (Non-hydrolyzing) n=1 Tax=Roseomonas gilardii TaxID=257708 RepID=A0ABU3MDF6_9PROT|nr:UDP-N-acetylglucosamine 2-epimerase (non-hydrolyzing) [Roseomonas gilardii]MDT8330954.1 UDP-N-acetylglucosamine 2-epimerase (non-hydrolyzing) [Roseomonas gilardii]